MKALGKHGESTWLHGRLKTRVYPSGWFLDGEGTPEGNDSRLGFLGILHFETTS